MHILHTVLYTFWGADKENLFKKSRTSLVGDHLLYCYLIEVRRNWMLVTLKGYEVEGKKTTSVAHLLNASLNG